MANRSGRTGRDGENFFLPMLRRLFGEQVERDKWQTPSSDYVGVPWPFEAKRQKVLQIPAWTRLCQDRHGDEWTLLVCPRDARLKGAHPPLAVVPLPLFERLVAAYMKDENDDLGG